MLTLDQSKRAAMSSLASARQSAYAFLSLAFTEPPSANVLDSIRHEDFLGSASVLFGADTAAPLCEYARSAEDEAELLHQARREFMKLLKVPGAHYISPYESVYRDTRDVAGKSVKGLLMGQSTVDVQKWYRLAALDLSGDIKEVPDHIGVELNYLAHLCAKERQFASQGDEPKLTRAWEMERDFLAAHVVRWIGLLRDKFYEKSKHLYFRAIADMAIEFTRRDLLTLEGLIGPSM